MKYSWKGYWGVPAAAVLIFALCTAAVEYWLPPGVSWAKAAIFSAVFMVSCALALSAYRYADDVLLQTHKTAWFWGSLTAMVALGPVIVIAGWHLLPLPLPHAHDGQTQIYFGEGIGFAFLVQAAAFLAVLSYQRLPRG